MNLVVGVDDGRTGARKLHAAVEDRDRDVRFGRAYALEEMLEAGEIKGFGGALAAAQAALFEDGVVEMEAVHRHHDRRALRQKGASSSAMVDLPAPGGPAMATTKRLVLAARLKMVAARLGDF